MPHRVLMKTTDSSFNFCTGFLSSGLRCEPMALAKEEPLGKRAHGIPKTHFSLPSKSIIQTGTKGCLPLMKWSEHIQMLTMPLWRLKLHFYLWHNCSSNLLPQAWSLIQLPEVVTKGCLLTLSLTFLLLKIYLPRAYSLPFQHYQRPCCLSSFLSGLRQVFTMALGSFSPEVVDKNGFQQILPRLWWFIDAEAF